MALIIRGGTLLTPAGPATADLRIEGGRISALGEGVATSGDETLDAGGCYVLPGGIDPHTHIEMPAGGGEFNADDWYSGTAAALAGGTTTVLDMITPERGGTLTAALGDWQGRAALRAACDYSFHMGLIEDSPALLAEMAAIVAAGVPSFKIYLAYKGRLMIDDGAAFRILRRAGALGALTLAHCENGEIIDTLIADRRAAGDLAPGNHPRVRPSLAEGEATARAIALAQLARAPLYVVHVTCREAIGAIAAARGQGQAVYGEACAHHLTLTEAEYERPGFAAAPYVLSPPLRGAADVAALREALRQGVLQTTATDHCPWHLQGQKDRGRADFTRIPNGAGGIQERLGLLIHHLGDALGWERLVAVAAANAARLFGLTGKGVLAPGADADVLVWDPQQRQVFSARTQVSRVDHNIYEGLAVDGAPRFVLSRGRLAVSEGRVHAEPGWGRFLARQPR